MPVKRRNRLGDALVAAKLLTREQIESAAKEALGAGMKLGEHLVTAGLIDEAAMSLLLCNQLGVERYRSIDYPADPALASIIPSQAALEHRIVPLAATEHLLKLGMLHPEDINTLDLVEQIAGREVDPVFCTEKELTQLVNALYGVNIGLNQILDRMAPMEVVDSPADSGTDENIEVSELLNMAHGAPAVQMVNMIIAQAVREGASDIHISPERETMQLRFRIDGRLWEVPPPPKAMMLSIISRVKVLARMDIATSRIPQDGRFTLRVENREINLRVSSIPTINGENVVLRILDMSSSTYTLDKLGMNATDHAKIGGLIQRPYGMILSTGPTGSGKSTSLYAILKELNSSDINIITVEDPVEYRVDHVRQVQLNRRAGMTFASGLRSILRQDPDVIMVGEIRDAETANIAVQAALTGHRVLSTVHTNDAAGSITRLIDMGIEPFLVASVLMVSFAQRLVRRVCPDCGELYTPSPESLDFWGLAAERDIKFRKAVGCDACRQSGYQGRCGIFEVLVVDDVIQEMIASNASAQQIGQVAREQGGMKILKEDAAQKLRSGITTPEEAMSTVIA
jgi:type IV pilus assembly protein PilB